MFSFSGCDLSFTAVFFPRLSVFCRWSLYLASDAGVSLMIQECILFTKILNSMWLRTDMLLKGYYYSLPYLQSEVSLLVSYGKRMN